MKKLSISLLLIFTLTHVFAADKIPVDLKTGFNSIQENNLRAQIGYLTSDALQGRLSLQPGDQQAINWIAKQFAASGLKPGNAGSYLQPVKLLEFSADKKKSYIEVDSKALTKRWQNPAVYLDYPKNFHLSNSIIFAGYGITAPELHYDDYANLNVKGKIVLVFEHEPQETHSDSIFNGIANTIYATNRVKALNAEQHGAIAILIAPEPNRTHPSNQQRRQRIEDKWKHSSILPTQVLADDSLHIPIIIISDEVANSLVSTKKLSQWQSQIDRHLTPVSQPIPNVTVVVQNQNKFSHLGTSYNVVGLLEGSDPQLKNETVIVSAHHDHDGMIQNQIWHGADDNASGTVGVVNLAQAFSLNMQNGLRPKRSILFVVFAAEERGLLGAFYMTQHPLRPLNTTRAVINFDMIGRNEQPSAQTNRLISIPTDTTNRLNLIGGHYSSDYEKTIETANQSIGLTLDHRFDNENALNIFFRSDQFPFVLNHIPAFWWFTGFHPDYHQITDTADKINYKKMKRILQLAYLTIYQFADEAQPPKFIASPKPM